jgi:hypothetical protein
MMQTPQDIEERALELVREAFSHARGGQWVIAVRPRSPAPPSRGIEP